MGIDLNKLSDDQLYQRLALIQSRMGWAANSKSPGVLAQLQYLQQEVNLAITERIEKINFDQNVLSTPSVVDIDAPKEKKMSEETTSRAKSKSDIITRLRRTSAPTKDTPDE